MEQFYKSLCDILSFAAGEEIVLKPLSTLSAEIVGLVGTGDLSWLAYFLSPLNLISLFIQGGMVYALCWILMYLPWKLFRSLFPNFRRRRRGD